ncbi:MAG: cobalt ECF transporter T component CbiQ [bacterium]
MNHLFLDKYSNLKSPIHQLDPRSKIIFFLLYIFFVITILPNDFLQFIAYFIIMFIVILISRIPLIYILKRTCVIIPFILLIAIFIPFSKKTQIENSYNIGYLFVSHNRLWIFWNMLIKSFLTILAMIVLSSTTKFSTLLKGLEFFKIPKILIMLLSFMYRYIFVLIDEAQRIEHARNSRYFGGEYLRQIKTIGNIIGCLFIKTYERGEKIYQSMLSRGFNGEIKILNRLNFSILDIYFCILFLGSLLAIKIWSIL